MQSHRNAYSNSADEGKCSPLRLLGFAAIVRLFAALQFWFLLRCLRWCIRSSRGLSDFVRIYARASTRPHPYLLVLRRFVASSSSPQRFISFLAVCDKRFRLVKVSEAPLRDYVVLFCICAIRLGLGRFSCLQGRRSEAGVPACRALRAIMHNRVLLLSFLEY